MPFYDETLGLYVYTTPLTISSQVLAAAGELGIALTWDAEGCLSRISHEAAISLSQKLGIVTLSISQFMGLASRRSEVASPRFAEWLSNTYTIDSNGVCYDKSGSIVDLLPGRPGWFRLVDVNEEGYPTKVNDHSSLGLWKYWSPNPSDPGVKCGAIRSFVTSSGACSLDLGIPADARHPMIMIRECYSALKPEEVSPIESIWNEYLSVTNRKDEAEIKRFITSQTVESFKLGKSTNTLLNQRDLERRFDLVGKKRVLLRNYDGLQTITMSDVRKILSGKPSKNTTYVVGHEHPDVDSVVSSIFESVRRSLVYANQSCLPWTSSLPPEVLSIVGPEVADLTMKVPEFSAYHRLTLVNCHRYDGANESQVIGVIDHHQVTTPFPAFVALSNESSWSTTLQIYIKILGSGFDLDPEASKILAEATMLEAEPQLMDRRPQIDRLALERLKTVADSSVRDYGALLDLMMVETNPSTLFYKDYRQTTFGFSVIHCKEYIDMTAIARENNSKHHLPLSVVKQILAKQKAPWITSERITLVFNDNFHDKGFQNVILDVRKGACEAFHQKKFKLQEHQLELDCIDTQTPRPWLTPHLEKVVQEHLKFTYSKRIQRYISSGFYSGGTEVYGDSDVTKAHLSYQDVNELLKDSINTSFMSLKQYWEVYNDLNDLNDQYFLSQLRDKTYVELLDTLIMNKSEVLGKHVEIVRATPGLIKPGEGNAKTGIPTAILDPNNYEDNGFWRYWSPDSEENVATRGHIFILDRISLDLKIRPGEKTSQLTFRPVYRDIPDLRYTMLYEADGEFEVKIIPRLFSIFEMDAVREGRRN